MTMIKPKELMLGDWIVVHDHGWNSDGTEWNADVSAKITDIGDGGICAENGGDEWLNMEYGRIDPVPLTREILEKNGFKKRENDIYHIGPRYVLTGGVEDYLVIVMPEDPPVHGVKFLTEIHTNCIGKSGVNTLHNCDIEYVHQLQHALRICGIEKEIKL